MKFFFKKNIIFFFILFFLVRLISSFDNIDKEYNTNFNIVKLNNYCKFDSLDILFVGNSYCYSGINPRYFDSVNVKAFNLGIATAGSYFYELLLDEYLQSVSVKPKSIFLLVSPITFSIKADNFDIYPIHRYLNNPVSNEFLTVKYNIYKIYFDIVRNSLKKSLKNVSNWNLKRNVEKERAKMFSCKGFVQYEKYSSNTIPDNSQKTDINNKNVQSAYSTLKLNKFDTHKFLYLIKFAHKLKKNGIQVVFYELPTNKLHEYFNRDYLDNYNSSLENIKKDFILIKNDIVLENSCYRNIDHMNSFGAQFATKNIITHIENNEKLKRLYKL